MKIIHLSDIHVGESTGTNFNACKDTEFKAFVAIVTYIINNYTPHETGVLITGDITDHAKPQEFAYARDEILRLKNLGFHCWIVPGNHDYTQHELPIASGIGFQDTSIDSVLMEHIYPALEWPMVWEFGDWHIVGLNSVLGQNDDKSMLLANGEIGDQQLNALREKISHIQGPTLIALHHHPIKLAECMEGSDVEYNKSIIEGLKELATFLEDGNELVSILRDIHADLVCFGHRHITAEIHNVKGLDWLHIADKSTRHKNIKIHEIDLDEQKINTKDVEYNEQNILNHLNSYHREECK